MRKNRIRLSESQLHRVIKESVKRVLKEDAVNSEAQSIMDDIISRNINCGGMDYETFIDGVCSAYGCSPKVAQLVAQMSGNW